MCIFLRRAFIPSTRAAASIWCAAPFLLTRGLSKQGESNHQPRAAIDNPPATAALQNCSLQVALCSRAARIFDPRDMVSYQPVSVPVRALSSIAGRLQPISCCAPAVGGRRWARCPGNLDFPWEVMGPALSESSSMD